MVQLKLKYEKCKRALESKINMMKKNEQKIVSSINGLKMDNTKLTENCGQIKTKIALKLKKMDDDDLGFRERKDEINNVTESYKKTIKQAFTYLMDIQSEINDNLNINRN